MRRAGSENFATFSLVGTAGDDNPWSTSSTVNSSGNSWHHYAAVWDAVNATRQLYVDGVLSISVANDYGPYYAAEQPVSRLRRERTGTAARGVIGYAFTKCKMDDVRIYDAPLSAAEVQALAAQEAGTIILYPQWMENLPGQKTTFSVTLVPQALQSGSVTVWITNTSPALVTIPGAVGNVLKLTFAEGSTNVQTFQAVSTAPGTANLTCGASDGALGNAAAVQVDTPLPPALVAHWTFDDRGQSVCRDLGLSGGGHARRDSSGDGGDLYRRSAGHDRELLGPDARGLSADHQHEFW